jgi:uncharacterized protein
LFIIETTNYLRARLRIRLYKIKHKEYNYSQSSPSHNCIFGAMLSVSQLFIYPIKSLGAISLNSAEVTDRGFKYDRRWMLVDEHNKFLTQRVFPQMALLKVLVNEDGLLVQHKKNESSIRVPFQATGKKYRVKVWSNVCKAIEVSQEIDEWFSDMLSMKCKLVYMPDETKRRVDSRYASNKEITSFSDAYPFMVIGQSSLDDLNSKLTETLPINRFRPSIVFTGGQPFEEDELAHFTINQTSFYGVKLCARCVVTTINQDDATKGKEPLHTLSAYRKRNNKIYFGQNLVHSGEGIISIGDSITVIERKHARFSRL